MVGGIKLSASNAAKLLDVKALERFGRGVAETVAERTAADVKHFARRSIKSGGKDRRSKKWKTSKPGEAPRSHVGTLKNAIRYARNGDRYVVGPEAVGGSTRGTLSALERGGVGRIVDTVYRPKYLRKIGERSRRKRVSPPCPKHGTTRGARPATARPYVVRGLWGAVKTVKEYRYFYSREEWEAARNSPEFQAWGEKQRRVSTLRPRFAARPYMAPALASATEPERAASRLRRAVDGALSGKRAGDPRNGTNRAGNATIVDFWETRVGRAALDAGRGPK